MLSRGGNPGGGGGEISANDLNPALGEPRPLPRRPLGSHLSHVAGSDLDQDLDLDVLQF